jgi:hypothetical protein
MIVDTLIGQMKFSGHVSIDRVPVSRTFGGLARRMSGGPDPKFSVNSLGFPAVLFIRRPSGGLAGLPAVILAGLTPNSPQRRY